MNVIPYSLICWVYYGLLVPSLPLIPPQLLLEDEAGSRPYNEDIVVQITLLHDWGA